MRALAYALFAILLTATLATAAKKCEDNAMTAPLPPYSINRGLHVHGICVDTLAVLMTLSGKPMTADDVKLMLWSHAVKIAGISSNAIVLNVPKEKEYEDKFKWVGPVIVAKYVVIARKDGKPFPGLKELDKYKTATIRGSFPEQALIAAGVDKSDLVSATTHVIPLKKLQSKMVDFLAHDLYSITYLMQKMRMKPSKYKVVATYEEVPLYYAFSKDTSDAFIAKLNENLIKFKKPGQDGKSRMDRIIAKYLPNGPLK